MVTRADIVSRLSQLGYTATQDDVDQLDFEIQLVINYTLDYCNLTNEEDIPELVYPKMIDRICSTFLFNKKNSGTMEEFDYEAAIKSIKEGDTTIHYVAGAGEDTPENRFDSMVKQLERGYDKWITHFRRLSW